MAKKPGTRLMNLPTLGVILLIAIMVIASFSIVIPAIWLTYDQFDRQAWSLVEQGSQMIKILLDTKNNELNNLAILTTQRPALAQLLKTQDTENLTSYLETLRRGANLDFLMICDDESKSTIQVGDQIPGEICQSAGSNRFYPSPLDEATSGWVIASQPFQNDPSKKVVVGQSFNNIFVDKYRENIDLELLFLLNGQLVGGSFPDNPAIFNTLTNPQSEFIAGKGVNTGRLNLDGVNYFALRSSYGDTGLETLIFLPGSVTAATQQKITQTMAIGILIVAFFSFTIAIFLTRRVSRPLELLRDSAIALRMGNLTTPIVTRTRFREIAEVSYALEDARIALHHSLEELEREKSWTEYLLKSVVEGVIALDRHARITFFSDGASRITGWKQEQVLGKNIDEILRVPDRSLRFSQLIPSPGEKKEIITILVNDTPLTISVLTARISPPEAGTTDLVISFRDITNEEAMRGLLGDFLANITHEFRTPLTALAVSIELLLDKLPDLNYEEIHELLVANHIGVLSLQNLINNLLEGASIEAGRFQVFPRPTDLATVVDEVIQIIDPLVKKNNNALKINLPSDLPLVQIDPRRTNQVLVNLLSNAVKWSPPGTEISLYAIRTVDDIRISIADQGPGIKPDQKQKLFTKFGHIQSENGRAEQGAGLGLSVVKAIVESQKGHVGVEDRQEGGVIFWFTIPVVSHIPSSEDFDA